MVWDPWIWQIGGSGPENRKYWPFKFTINTQHYFARTQLYTHPPIFCKEPGYWWKHWQIFPMPGSYRIVYRVREHEQQVLKEYHPVHFLIRVSHFETVIKIIDALLSELDNWNVIELCVEVFLPWTEYALKVKRSPKADTDLLWSYWDQNKI